MAWRSLMTLFSRLLVMIVFLLLLLVLVAGFVYFYIKNKGVGVDRPLSEGFELMNDKDYSLYYYFKLSYHWDGDADRNFDNYTWNQRTSENDFPVFNFPRINNTNLTTANVINRPIQRVYNVAVLNALKRKYPTINFMDVNYPIFSVLKTTPNWRTSAYNLSSSANWRNINDGWENTGGGYYTTVDYYQSGSDDFWAVIRPTYITDQFSQVNGVYPGSQPFGAEGDAPAYMFPIFELDNLTTQECLNSGVAIAKRNRSDFFIEDTPDKTKLGDPLTGNDKTSVNNACKAAIINEKVTFSRSCDSQCNETYVNTFSRYGVAFNIENLSLCDGCNTTQDLLGDSQATPAVAPLRNLGSYIPQPNSADLIVSRSLSDTGSTYTLRLPQNAKYLLGGTFSDPRNTPIKYRIDIEVLNGSQRVYTGFMFNVTLSRAQQIIEIQFDGSSFKISANNEIYIAAKTSQSQYQETTGDIASFTISALADASYDARYDYYNNNGTIAQSTGGSASGATSGATSGASTTGSVGFVSSTQSYFPLYRGTVGGSLGDMSGNVLALTYDTTTKTKIIGTFAVNSAGSQPVPRALGAGTYAIYASNETTDFFAGKQRTLTLTGNATRILIDTTTGGIDAFNNSTKVSSNTLISSLSEKGDPQTFSMQIRDGSGRFIYYSTAQPFTIIGNRYPPTTAPPANSLQECFLIQETNSEGVPLTSNSVAESEIADICSNFDGRIATITDVQADLAAGADWCTGGWIQMTPNLVRVGYPITTSMAKCLPAGNQAIKTAGTVVITPLTATKGIVCYGTKPPNDIVFSLNIMNNISGTTTSASRYFKIVYFNEFKKQWARSSKGTNMEIFAVKSAKAIEKQSNDICYDLGFVRATKAQLDELAANKTNTADMTEPGYVADDRVRSFVVINESADNSALSITGTPGVNESSSTTVFANYCYGTKPSTRTIKDASNNSYTIIDYNARRRVWSQYTAQPYKTYNLTNRKAITDEKNAYRRAALIVNDVQTSGVGAMKKPNSGNPYIGCDINAYGCKPTAAAERDTAPPQLVSKTKKFKAINEATPIDPQDLSAAGMQRAINFVLACQRNGGAVPTADGEYPGCEGPCCVPEASEGRIDATMIKEACEPPKSAASAEECDADEDAKALGLKNFQPFKLSRVVKAPTTKVPHCKSAKLDPAMKTKISQNLYKDVLDTLKNEKLFSLRMPAQ
jgi:hypothetical protein